MNAQAVYCPTCDAEPGAPCTTPGPYTPNQRVLVLATPHPDRIVAAKTESFRPVSRWRGLPLPEPTGRWVEARQPDRRARAEGGAA